jgi:HEAT repeat protein
MESEILATPTYPEDDPFVIAQVLSNVRAPEMLSILVSRLEATPRSLPGVRYVYYQGIAECKHFARIAYLIEAARHSRRIFDRLSAINALSYVIEPEAADALKLALQKERGPEVRAECFVAYARVATELGGTFRAEARRMVVAALSSRSPTLRDAAVEAAWHLKSKAVLRALRNFVEKYPSSEVAVRAANAIAFMGSLPGVRARDNTLDSTT